ncbi:MAG: hypothetical protein HY726_21340 [Candidatus Rokubacteria bacterium]|nr:hypothetical protein [Candidatus Rokubacteria bacterium]
MEEAERVSRVQRIHRTRREQLANELLRCGWILLGMKDGSFILGQITKLVCPRCQSAIEYDKVKIDDDGWHKIDCASCGASGLPRGVSFDEYFIDKLITDKDLW